MILKLKYCYCLIREKEFSYTFPKWESDEIDMCAYQICLESIQTFWSLKNMLHDLWSNLSMNSLGICKNSPMGLYSQQWHNIEFNLCDGCIHNDWLDQQSFVQGLLTKVLNHPLSVRPFCNTALVPYCHWKKIHIQGQD